MAFRSQLENLVICEYHLQELHLWSSRPCKPSSGIIFILGVYMSDGSRCQWYHLSLDRTPFVTWSSVVYPLENLMLTSRMAGRCDYFIRHHQQSRSMLPYSCMVGTRNPGNWHTTVIFGCTSTLSTPTRFPPPGLHSFEQGPSDKYNASQ